MLILLLCKGYLVIDQGKQRFYLREVLMKRHNVLKSWD